MSYFSLVFLTGVCTLRDGTGETYFVCGMISACCNCSAKVMSTLQSGLSACNDGDVVEGGYVRILIISPAAFRIKSSSLICGKGAVMGNEVTVLQPWTVLVLGK